MAIIADKPSPVHPGRLLRMVLAESGVTQSGLARAIGVTHSKVNEICQGKRGISAEMAVRFGKALNTGPQVWLNAQKNWELSQVDQSKTKNIRSIIVGDKRLAA